MSFHIVIYFFNFADYDAKHLVPQSKFIPDCETLVEHFEVALVKAVAKCRMQTLIALADVFQYVGYGILSINFEQCIAIY